MKQKWVLFITLLAAVLTALLSIFIGGFSNAITSEAQAHPLRFGVALVLLILAVAGASLWLSRRAESGSSSPASLSQRERTSMLALLQREVQQALDVSLQGAALQALGLRDQPQAVLALSSTSLIQSQSAPQAETSIVHAYEEAKQRKLLILGGQEGGNPHFCGNWRCICSRKLGSQRATCPCPLSSTLPPGPPNGCR